MISKPRSAGTGSLSPGQRPWPGIWSSSGHPDCEYCSWAWRGEAGRMEVKYMNTMCPRHRMATVTVTATPSASG